MTSASRPVALFVDGHSLAYRAYHALPETLTAPDGTPTNAVVGFWNMLAPTIARIAPQSGAICFDSPAATWRHAVDPEYKATRSPSPSSLPAQLGLIRELARSMGVPTFNVPGYEADDLLATLATRAVDQGFRALILTGDRDVFQLASDHITVLWTRKSFSDIVEMTPSAVTDYAGVPPHLYPQYAALRGDSSDNLPGVPRVGAKTAAKLLGQFGSIDGIYAHLDELTPAIRQAFVENRERIAINLGLTILERNAPNLPHMVETLTVGPPDLAAVAEVCERLGYASLLSRLAA